VTRRRASIGPARSTAQRGFTLVELMIVLVIFALAAAAVVLAMPDPRGRIRDNAERFAARIRAAHDAAIVDARPVSVWVTAGGYGFDERVAGRWQPIDAKPLRMAQWANGVAAMPTTAAGRDRVVFDATGMADRSLSVDLRREGQSVRVSIGANGAVRVDG
jgi:general secretion pathway protein H